MKWLQLSAVALVSVVMMLVLAACGAGAPASAPKSAEPINIGVSAPLTGQFAENGGYMKNGIGLAVKEINDKGGINGRPIQLFWEDDQGPNPTAASNAVTKLITQDNVVAVIGPHFSPAMLPTEPIFQKYSVPALTGATGPPITAQGNKWIFRIRLNDEIGARLLVKYAVEELKFKKIGLDYVNTAFGQGGIEVVKDELTKRGITPVATETHMDDTKDFTPQILSFQDKGVDGIIVWTDDQPSGLLAKQMATLGAKFKLVGSTTFSQPPFLKLAGDAANGAISISDFSPNNPDKNIQDWAKKYSGVYNAPPELYASAYYDATNILAEAIKKASKVDGPSIQQALNGIKDFQGVMTQYSWSSNGDMVHSGLITEVKNGKTEVIQVVKEK
ncbi:MAG: ABC transporter substrate-binding protein [Chloroflexi bacterium]|nr:ABC transporter substrate-binding protein [Chloroflexota bacterium]